MTHTNRALAISARLAIVSACALGVWSSWRIARADHFFRQDTAESLRTAIRYAPDNSEYYFRLGQLDQDHADELFETALRLNQYNAPAAIELGLINELNGHESQAEGLLLHAANVDRTYLPRWTLANFYLRRDDIQAFWTWARKSAEMPSENIGALFNLCWRVSPDPELISQRLMNGDPELTRQYLSFLLGKDQLVAAATTSMQLARTGAPETDRASLFSVIDEFVAANDGAQAISLWHELSQQRWVVADPEIPNNPNFAREPLHVSFDWKLQMEPGLHSWPGPSGLETEFSGDEPESSTIAEQTVILAPGKYIMKYAYRTKDIAPGTGIHWQLLNAKTGLVLADSPSLSCQSLNRVVLPFSVNPENSLLSLSLIYKRALGTPRISGTLVILSIELQRVP